MGVFKIPKLEIRNKKLYAKWILHGDCQCDIKWDTNKPIWKRDLDQDSPGFVCFDCMGRIIRLHRKGEKSG
jgi:hypothetical protein